MDAVSLIEAARLDGVNFEVVDGEVQIEARADKKYWLSRLRPWKSEIQRLLCGRGSAEDAEVSRLNEFPDVQPLPDELPPVAPYVENMLPERIGGFVGDVAERLQCPPDFTAVATVAVLGSAIGRRCAIRPKRRDNWTVVPNLWGGVVGRPSLLKTPAIKAPISLLEQLEAQEREEFAARQRQYEVRRQLADLQAKEARNKAVKALRDGDEEAACAILAVPEVCEPVRRRYVTNDATVEKLGEILAENPAGVMNFRDELVGWFHGLEKENQQGARAFFLEAWDGTGRFTYDRIGRGTIDIESAVVSIFGGIQPGRLSRYVKSAVRSGPDDDGLIQRFQLIVWPDAPRKWRNVDRWPDSEARRRVFDIIKRLRDFDSSHAEVDDYDHARIPFLRFEESAQQAFDAWRAWLERWLRSGDEHPAIESHLGKYRSLIPALALIFHLAEHERGPVGHEALALAIRWGEYLVSHARRIYSAATAVEVIAAKAIWRHIETGDLNDVFTARDIYRRCWTGLDDADTVRSALELLTDHGYLVQQAPEGAMPRGRPPSARYVINPRAKGSRNGTARTDKSTSGSFVGRFVNHSANGRTRDERA